MHKYQIGQRWISTMEPELGLGIITAVEQRRIRIHFPASECERQYAVDVAPIKRVRFSAGDTVRTNQGDSLTIVRVEEKDGLIVYHGDRLSLAEDQLSDSLAFSSPSERFLGGFYDDNRAFNLRTRTRHYLTRYLAADVRGFMGGRIDLIPHQIYVAQEVTGRLIQRALLADEVGLGKTIEACLIVHRLLQSGRISRVLILVPETLVHQWFVELLRRFNLMFRNVDQPFCESFAENNPDDNVFLDHQCFISSIDFLSKPEKWRQQAVEAGWDMVVFDEAHHMNEGSDSYRFAEMISGRTHGLLLLTATPQQLGHKGHFARLRLLDPARYHDFKAFENEQNQYRTVASIVDRLLKNESLSSSQKTTLVRMLPEADSFLNESKTVESDDSYAREIIDRLLDRYGTGRAIYRNTRAAISDFPVREVSLIALESRSDDYQRFEREFLRDMKLNHETESYSFTKDERIIWLVDFLGKHRRQKVVLICRSVEKVLAIAEAIRSHRNVKAALFHEQLTLLQRDRNAAWFAEPDGARILICSEIGSEGRNFQFAHILVLFDLPCDPELLEQRIGRLDRLGQKQTVQIYVPYVTGTPQEKLTTWYHEGLNAFEQNVAAAYEIYLKIGSKVLETASGGKKELMPPLIEKTRTLKQHLSESLESGRDRLLELHSHKPDLVQPMIREIEAFSLSQDLDHFMLNIFDRFNIRYHDIAPRTYHLNFEFVSDSEFPLPPLRSNELTATFDRKIALIREDVLFLSWDHPMVTGSIDLLLGSERGNCAVAMWTSKDKPEILLETIYVLECVAPRHLFVDRFLPSTPVRVVLNQEKKDCTDLYSESLLKMNLRDAANNSFWQLTRIRQEIFPQLLRHSRALADRRIQPLIESGLAKMEACHKTEIDRLRALGKINPNIGESEVNNWIAEHDALRTVLANPILRLDALRMIYKGSMD